jgi:hypothetical protein
MTDYIFHAHDAATDRTLEQVAISSLDLFALCGLKIDLEDDARAGESIDGTAAPSIELVEAMPRLDPERWMFTHDDPEWVTPKELGSAVASPAAVARWAATMASLDGFVPDKHRAAWDRVRAALDGLVARSCGLMCGVD